jgi:hypothetical protein
MAYFNTTQRYVCHAYAGGVLARELAPGEKAEAEGYGDVIRATIRPPKSRRKVGRSNGVLSYTAANKMAPMDEAAYRSYLRIACVCERTKFFRESTPVVQQYGETSTNTYHSALLRMAKHHDRWIREPESWNANKRNGPRAFRSLLSHVFEKYATSPLLDTVWFREKENWIPCYIEVVQGASLRRVEALQFPLTKKMAHLVLSAPSHLSLEEALRWGQVHALGGSAREFAVLMRTRIPCTSRNNPAGHAFWQTVIAWLLAHPMLDTHRYGPLIDYIRRQKYQHPAFSMSGRTPQALLRDMEGWHRELGTILKERDKVPPCWNGHGLDWWWNHKGGSGCTVTWRFEEITTYARLHEEGRTMHHCVVTYGLSCADGKLAIFSLQRDGEPVLTVEYVPGKHKIGEVRGKMNRVPTPEEWRVIERWAHAKQLG